MVYTTKPKFSDLSKFTEHSSYVTGDQIAEICAPLFNSFPINYFCYAKWYGNSGVLLASDKNWLRHYVQSDYNFLMNGKSIHAWSSTMPPKALAEAVFEFNFHNGIMLEKIHSDYVETLEFAAPNQHANPLEFCCNKDLLNHFYLYFKDKARTIIQEAENNPIIFPESRFLQIDNLQCQTQTTQHKEFYNSIKHKKIRFKLKAKEILFSPREFDVLCLLAKGKNIAEVAEILQISRRTVETYLYDAKNKAGMFTVKQLLDNFTDNLL